MMEEDNSDIAGSILKKDFVIELDENTFARLVEILETDAPENEKLKRLMELEPIWKL